ncbi:DUF6252 family protein [Flammeovirgaceae bacterium SG7u.111]|nr:DUF6252 family protein [Flammeovirgaceae bacterium SG7u.132]WPO33836.1 DUF6252 family protein [Flammeovirgaceae bacterium SG7u.111]
MEPNYYAATINNGFTNITGRTDDGQVITITLSDDNTGVYTLEQSSVHVAAYTEQIGANAHTTNGSATAGGTVEITAIDKTEGWISGTFSFTLVRAIDNSTVSVTNGTINKVLIGTASGGGSNSFSLKVDGTDWTATSAIAYVALGTLQISATSNDNNKTFSLSMPPTITPGTYDIESFGDYSAQYNIGTSVFLTADQGKLIISKHDIQNRTIEGTFNFEASELIGSNTASITEGSFSVNY